jgi:acyl-CoA reductase-like NAD-dependent aldehyde dehydrogenase
MLSEDMLSEDMLSEERLLIDGKLVPASSGRVDDNVNPATEQVIGAADATDEDFDAATAAAGLGPDARAVREEIFGPVLVVQAHDGDEHAIALANDSEYGLSGGVVSTDPERARAVSRRLRTGTVGINGGLWYAPDVPFGGFKQSGIGREFGVVGFEQYTELTSIADPA